MSINPTNRMRVVTGLGICLGMSNNNYMMRDIETITMADGPTSGGQRIIVFQVEGIALSRSLSHRLLIATACFRHILLLPRASWTASYTRQRRRTRQSCLSCIVSSPSTPEISGESLRQKIDSMPLPTMSSRSNGSSTLWLR